MDLGEEEAPGRGFGGEGTAFVAEAKRQNHEAHFSEPKVEVVDAEKLQIKARALLKSVDIEEGTVAYLQSHGHVQTGYEDEFDARPPTDPELKFFGLARDSLAVIEHRRVAYDQNGDPYRLTVTIYKPGSNRIRFIVGEVPDAVWQSGS